MNNQEREVMQRLVDEVGKIRNRPTKFPRQMWNDFRDSLGAAAKLLEADHVTAQQTPDPLPDHTKVKIGTNLYDTCEFEVTPENGVVITLDKPETYKQRLELLADCMDVLGIVFVEPHQFRVDTYDLHFGFDLVDIEVNDPIHGLTPSDLRRAAGEVFGE